MKKILFGMLLMVLGTFAFGASGKATVTVRAEIISEELVVGGVNNKPLIIDFGKNNENGKLDFVVQYSGVENTANSTSQVKFALTSSDVQLTNEKANSTLTSNIKLDKNTQMLANKDAQVIGSIQGNIKGLSSKTAKGIYAGVTELNITVIPM